ncbi:MAG: hypothetical protein REI12_07490 [Pedobacter sp.]|nr:hypothetical protein [Pedobacter sp.]
MSRAFAAFTTFIASTGSLFLLFWICMTLGDFIFRWDVFPDHMQKDIFFVGGALITLIVTSGSVAVVLLLSNILVLLERLEAERRTDAAKAKASGRI